MLSALLLTQYEHDQFDLRGNRNNRTGSILFWFPYQEASPPTGELLLSKIREEALKKRFAQFATSTVVEFVRTEIHDLPRFEYVLPEVCEGSTPDIKPEQKLAIISAALPVTVTAYDRHIRKVEMIKVFRTNPSTEEIYHSFVSDRLERCANEIIAVYQNAMLAPPSGLPA